MERVSEARSSTPRFTVYTEAVGAGIGRYTYELSQALIEVGADAQLLAPSLPWEADRAFAGARRILLPTPKGTWRPRKIASLIFRAAAGFGAALKVGRREPIVFSHLVGVPPFSILGMLGAKLAGAKSALLLHDFYPHRLRFPGPLQPVERYLYRWAYRRFDVVVGLTPDQTLLLREIGLPASAIACIPHGVFPLRGVEAPAPAAPLSLLIFGSLRANKRVGETIRAVQQLRAAGVDVRLIIAGSPVREEAAYWANCLHDIRAAPDGIEVMARFIEEDELPSILSRAHAFICPYKNFDSQSGVAMLALSNGAPLIATRTVGLPEGLDSACQIIGADANVGDIVDGVAAFIDQGAGEMRRRALAARDTILQQRSWVTIARELVARLAQAGFFDHQDKAAPAPQGAT